MRAMWPHIKLSIDSSLLTMRLKFSKLPVKFRIVLKISFFTYKTLWKTPSYLHPMLAASLPSCSPRLSCLSLGSRLMQAQEYFTLVSFSMQKPPTVCLFSYFSCNLQEASQDISWTWPPPYKHLHAWWPIDVMELLHQFSCWAPIWLLHHSVWLSRRYWCQINLIAWLTDWRSLLYIDVVLQLQK